jgi:hypothetical protein
MQVDVAATAKGLQVVDIADGVPLDVTLDLDLVVNDQLFCRAT